MQFPTISNGKNEAIMKRAKIGRMNCCCEFKNFACATWYWLKVYQNFIANKIITEGGSKFYYKKVFEGLFM